MKVQIKIGIASEHWSHAPEQIVDVDDVTATAWCESGVAVPVTEEETSVAPEAPAPETLAAPAPATVAPAAPATPSRGRRR